MSAPSRSVSGSVYLPLDGGGRGEAAGGGGEHRRQGMEPNAPHPTPSLRSDPPHRGEGRRQTSKREPADYPVPQTSDPLNFARRATLARLADVIAPRTGRMPGAGDLSLAAPGGPIDRVLALRPDLAADLGPVLDGVAPASDPASIVAALHPAALAVLMQAVAGAYYMHPQVMALIAYAGQEAGSLGRGEIGGEDLLERMMARPARWRGRPEETGSR